MALAVAVYYQFVNRLKNQSKQSKLILEKKVSIRKDWFGTVDCALLLNRTLYVIDYKHGSGIVVNVKDNPQLTFYGVGALRSIGLDKVDELVLVIVQPRTSETESIKSWTIENPKSFYKKWIDKFHQAEKRIDRTKFIISKKGIKNLSPIELDKCFATGDHCRYCKAKSICPKLQKAMTSLAKSDFDTTPGTSTYTRVLPAPAPNKLSPDQISEILSKADLVQLYIKAVKERALELMLDGIDISGFKAVYGNTHRKWTNSKEIQKYLVKKLGDKAFSKPQLLTPAQASNLIGKEFVKKNTKKPQGKPSIASNSDNRPAIRMKAQLDFLD
jgi:hypothetical protein